MCQCQSSYNHHNHHRKSLFLHRRTSYPTPSKAAFTLPLHRITTLSTMTYAFYQPCLVIALRERFCHETYFDSYVVSIIEVSKLSTDSGSKSKTFQKTVFNNLPLLKIYNLALVLNIKEVFRCHQNINVQFRINSETAIYNRSVYLLFLLELSRNFSHKKQRNFILFCQKIVKENWQLRIIWKQT